MYLIDAFKLLNCHNNAALNLSHNRSFIDCSVRDFFSFSSPVNIREIPNTTKNGILISDSVWGDYIDDIFISDYLLEIIESKKWNCIFFDYSIDSIGIDFGSVSFDQTLIKTNSAPSNPCMIAINCTLIPDLSDSFPDFINPLSFSLNDYIYWLSFFALDSSRAGESFMLWPPLRVNKGVIFD